MSTSSWDQVGTYYQRQDAPPGPGAAPAGSVPVHRWADRSSLPTFEQVVSPHASEHAASQDAALVRPARLNDLLDHPAPPPEPSPDARRRKRHSVVAAVVIILLVLASVATGGYMIYQGIHLSDVEEEMVLPDEVYHNIPVDESPVTLTDDLLDREWPVVNADSDQGSNTWDINTEKYRIETMSIARMTPGSVFIPRVGIYAEVRGSSEFVDSGYEDLQTITIPTNVHRGVWYSSGGPLTPTDTAALAVQPTEPVEQQPVTQVVQPEDTGGQTPGALQSVPDVSATGDQGTVLIASHVSWTRQHRGAFYTMATDVEPGELVWVKGFDGSLSTWRVNSMWYAEHEAFPQDYFDATGPRRLVLTTCGGRTNSLGFYQQNVFTVAVPVPLEVATQEIGG